MSTNFDDYLNEQILDPDFKAEYEAFRAEFMTVDYYNNHRVDFADRTQAIDFHEIQDLFFCCWTG